LSQINDRTVYGAYEAATNRLFVASAANRAVATALEQRLDRVAAAKGRRAVRVTDVKPLRCRSGRSPVRTQWRGSACSRGSESSRGS
jgi:hypothetical protein